MIIVQYRSIDRCYIRRRFKTLAGARAFAWRYVGRHPEIGGWYAVSGDGVGRVTVEGATLDQLFPSDWELGASREAEEDLGPDPLGDWHGRNE